MKRAKFPNGVVIDQDTLVDDGMAKINAILQRHTDGGAMGIIAGLTVSVDDSSPTKVKVGTGIGYAPNGELIDVQAVVNNIQLSDYSAGVKNYILAMYSEIDTTPEADDDTGEVVFTRAESSYTIKALTESQYKSLPATNTNFAVDAADRALVLGVVLGPGNSGTALNSGNIFNAQVRTTILTVSQPVAITGVKINQIDTATPIGSGSLIYNPGAITLQWTAPLLGGSLDTPGTAVFVGNGGPFVLASGNGQTLAVGVVASSLPAGSAPITDSIRVYDLYDQLVPAFSPADQQHRHFVGSGTPTTHNPHGLTLDDIGATTADTQGAIAKHRTEQHDSEFGLHNTATAGAITIRDSDDPDSVVVGALSAGDYVFVGGNVITNMTVQTVSLPHVDATRDPGLYEIYVNEMGVVLFSRRIEAKQAANPSAASMMFVRTIDLSENWIGNATTELAFAYNHTTDELSLNGRNPVKVSSLGGNPGCVRLYADVAHKLWIDLWVYPGAKPPALDIGEQWSVLDPADPTRRNMLVLAAVSWTGNADGILGYNANTVNGTPRYPIDKRYRSFRTGSTGRPGIAVGVDGRRQQGVVTWSKDSSPDLSISWDDVNALVMWRGNYSNTRIYNHNDAVFSGGSTYVAIVDGIYGHAPPDTNYWLLMAAGGATGGIGTTGPQGPAGPQGPQGPAGVIDENTLFQALTLSVVKPGYPVFVPTISLNANANTLILDQYVLLGANTNAGAWNAWGGGHGYQFTIDFGNLQTIGGNNNLDMKLYIDGTFVNNGTPKSPQGNLWWCKTDWSGDYVNIDISQTMTPGKHRVQIAVNCAVSLPLPANQLVITAVNP